MRTPKSASPRRSVIRPGRSGRSRRSAADSVRLRLRLGDRLGRRDGLGRASRSQRARRDSGCRRRLLFLLLLLLDHPLQVLGDDPPARPFLLAPLAAALAGQGVLLPELAEPLAPGREHVAERRLDGQGQAADDGAEQHEQRAHEAELLSGADPTRSLPKAPPAAMEPSRQPIRPTVSWSRAGVEASRISAPKPRPTIADRSLAPQPAPAGDDQEERDQQAGQAEEGERDGRRHARRSGRSSCGRGPPPPPRDGRRSGRRGGRCPG